MGSVVYGWKLIAEGHSINVEDKLNAISDVFLNSVDCRYIPDEIAEEGFPNMI